MSDDSYHHLWFPKFLDFKVLLQSFTFDFFILLNMSFAEFSWIFLPSYLFLHLTISNFVFTKFIKLHFYSFFFWIYFDQFCQSIANNKIDIFRSENRRDAEKKQKANESRETLNFSSAHFIRGNIFPSRVCLMKRRGS